MTLEQRAHDIGIAFATCKMNSRDNSNDDEMAKHTQFLNFITDYTFAVSSYVATEAESGNVFKD